MTGTGSVTSAAPHRCGEVLFAAKLYSRAEIPGAVNPVPAKAGVYAWFFRSIPAGVPTNDCIIRDGLALLYVGIAPRMPREGTATLGARTLVGRFREHRR